MRPWLTVARNVFGELVHLLVDHRLHRQVAIGVALRVVPHRLADAPALPGEPGVDPELAPGLGGQPPVEEAERLDLEAMAPVAAILQAHDAAFQRMDALGLEPDLEHGHEARRLGRIAAGRGAVAARDRADVLGRVVALPGVAIGLVELGDALETDEHA